jgi:hypothetical protein
MVPHIVFHVPDDGYFPGPTCGRTGGRRADLRHHPAAVAGFARQALFDRAADKRGGASARGRCCPRRTPGTLVLRQPRSGTGEGLVAILHPWESGRDNSIDWDEALRARADRRASRPTRGATPSTPTPRTGPTKAQYDRYLWLVQHFRSLGWDNARLHDASPFRVVDPGFNAILIRSAPTSPTSPTTLGETEIAAANRARAGAASAALDACGARRTASTCAWTAPPAR